MHKICRDFTDSKGTSEEGLGVKPNGTIKGGGKWGLQIDHSSKVFF